MQNIKTNKTNLSVKETLESLAFELTGERPINSKDLLAILKKEPQIQIRFMNIINEQMEQWKEIKEFREKIEQIDSYRKKII